MCNVDTQKRGARVALCVAFRARPDTRRPSICLQCGGLAARDGVIITLCALGQSGWEKREPFFRMTKLEFQKRSQVIIPSGDFAIVKKLFLWELSVR